jgi:hypothetical protein
VKQNIIEFLDSSIEEGPNYILPEDRIATFDNDGTLWAEKPIPVQLNFIFLAFAKIAKNNPSLVDEQPYKALLEGDTNFFRNAIALNPEAIKVLEVAFANYGLEKHQPNSKPMLKTFMQLKNH